MNKYGIGELRRYLNVDFTRNALPASITSDGEVVAILLSVEQYNRLIMDYKSSQEG